ncbi:hypothetical protein GGH93_001976 [Coemansia aciculifera]|nr:hypothetical protein GGH93_001976 [Coemansia aciculifera]
MELLYGYSPIKAAIMQGRREIYGLYCQGRFMGDEPRDDMNDIIKMARAQLLPIKEVMKSDMTDAIYGANHQGVLLKVGRMDAARVRGLGPLVNGRYTLDLATGVVELEPRRKFPLLVCLDGIQDERNLGSIIRSALFFGADGILLSGKDACRPSPIVSKTSSGAMECLAIYKAVETPKVLTKARENGWSVVCTTVKDGGLSESNPLHRISKLNSPTVLVLGSEGGGVSHAIQNLSDIDVHIPARSDIPSYIDSLNVGVAAGIILSALKFVGDKETPTPRELFCAAPSGQTHLEAEFGEGCAHEHRMRRDNQYVRRQLFLRDGGICYDCGIDANALFVQAVACTTLDQRVNMFRVLAKRTHEWRRKVKRPLTSMEYKFTEGMFWEAAHKVDVKHGGGLCGLDGFQTLCVPCHSDEYMRSYLADISSMSLFRSPTGAASDADTPLLLSAGRGGAGRASHGLLSAQHGTPPSFALSPIQPSSSARFAAESPLALMTVRTSRGRQQVETSPISLSSTSDSSLPSPTSSYIFCVPSRSRLHESPTKSPPANKSNQLGGVRCQHTQRATASQSKTTPSKQLPLVQLSAIIDLTTSTRELASHACDRPELDMLADMLTTINVSSSGEESSSEVEIIQVVPRRIALSTRKLDTNSRNQGDTQQQQPVAKAKGHQPVVIANEDQSRPRLAQKSMSDNSSTLRCPSLTRVSSRTESASQENSPAARGLVPL